MAENDIYDNKLKYERFKENLSELTISPNANGSRVYYCKNVENLEYFRKLFVKFEVEDISFIRRCRLLHVLKIVVHNTTKNLRYITRDDIDAYSYLTAWLNVHPFKNNPAVFCLLMKLVTS